MNQPISFSGLKKFEQCPYQFYRVKVKQDIKDDYSHPAAIWGNEVHKAIENYLRDGTPLSDRFESYAEYAEALAAISGDHYIELKLAIDKDSNNVPFDWPNAAYRGILDFLAVKGDRALLIDHKTGKIRPTKQLHFNALLVWAAFPEVDRIDAAFYWTQGSTYTKHQFFRKNIDHVWAVFRESLNNLDECFETNLWPVGPSPLCGYCPVTDCIHNSRS